VLHALHPGRIDLGLGRAPGGTGLDAYALRRDRERQPPDDFPRQLIELLTFLDGTFPPQHAFSQIKVSPAMPGGPDVWLLGSSMWSASAAAQVGLPYAFAHFIEQNPTRAALEHYRASFNAKGRNAKPEAIVALGAICAETDEEAEYLLASARLFRRRIRMGDIRPIPTPEEALSELGPVREVTAMEAEFPRYIIGSPETIRTKLIDMASVLHLDELMIVTIVHDHRARMRSHELLAEAFELKPRTPDERQFAAT
jgi:luciferase family oxidoreductase group 1